MRQEEQFLDIPQLMARHHLADETEIITRRGKHDTGRDGKAG